MYPWRVSCESRTEDVHESKFNVPTVLLISSREREQMDRDFIRPKYEVLAFIKGIKRGENDRFARSSKAQTRWFTFATLAIRPFVWHYGPNKYTRV